MLKNFSSLKAIISALNSNSIYRLSKVWEFLPKERVSLHLDLVKVSTLANLNFIFCRWKSSQS